jgi:hypothetical protein
MNTIGSSDLIASLERLAKRAEDPAFVAERAREEAKRVASGRREATAQRLKLLEAVPLRAGLAPLVAAIPRHLDAAECNCTSHLGGALPCVTPDGYEETPCVSLVRRWLDARRKSPQAWKPILVILGGTGIGKTAAGAWAFTRYGGGTYTKSRQLTIAHRSMFGENEAAWRNMCRAGFAFLDDIGRESDEHSIAAIEDFVDERQGRPTIITSNLTRADLLGRYGARVASRLAESGVIQWVKDRDRRQP